MKGKLPLFLGWVILQQPILANGGGYFRGGMERAGDVAGFEPKDTEKIRILDEKLTVQFGPSAAEVEVRYLMHNETDKTVKVRFGFPVEESFDRELMTPVGEDGSKKVKDLKYCQNYTIAASGKTITSKWQVEAKPSADKQFQGIAGWQVSEISFAGGEEKPVLIRFRSSSPLESWSVSDNTSDSASAFRYRLSTAACWAGTIGTGRIVLKPNGIDPKELKVIKPVNRFKKEGDHWIWNFENLEPTMADDLEIESRPAVNTHYDNQTSCYIERGDQWLMSHSNYEVRASSVLPPADGKTYDAANVKHFWGDETWCEGKQGPGIGEWLEISPVSPKPLAAIEILPGYTKDEALFKANARPKTILINLNGEHQFTVEIPDSKEPFRIPILGYAKSVKKIGLTFQDVWKGSRYEDLCVSGVRLEVKLDKKPKLAPVR